jgi:hypothetical protein
MELCSNTNLDEGDVVRIIRRTLDFLNQIPHAPHLGDELKRNAIRAIQLIDRFPIREVIALPNAAEALVKELEDQEDLEDADLDAHLDGEPQGDQENDV